MWFLLLLPLLTFALPMITLNSTNSLILKGEINKQTVNQLLINLHNLNHKNKLYLFLDTHGGSVEEGYKIISEVSKNNISCIVEKAYSMGFAILQACKKRYMLPFGKIMQHQISFGVSDEKAKVESYLKYIQQVEQKLAGMQAKRIGIPVERFRQKTYNDWWMFGEHAILEKCADKIVNIKCDPKLSKERFTLSTSFYEYFYSKCPLITDYITKKQKKEISIFF